MLICLPHLSKEVAGFSIFRDRQAITEQIYLGVTVSWRVPPFLSLPVSRIHPYNSETTCYDFAIVMCFCSQTSSDVKCRVTESLLTFLHTFNAKVANSEYVSMALQAFCLSVW